MTDSDHQSTLTISNRTAGITGLCLSGGLLILAVWRVVYHFSSNNFSWSSRRVFHALFCVAMLVEALSYADLCGLLPLSDDPDLSERFGYILLEVVGRSLLEVLTYSVVTALWLETAGKNVGEFGQKLLIVCGAIVLSTSILQASDMVRSEQEVLWIYQLHGLVEAFCWLLHCAAAVACCILTTKRIISLSTFPQLSSSAQIKILAKALLPMLLCAACYGLRSAWLYSFELESRTPTYSRESLIWWIGFMWIPTLTPSLMLLYSTRKRDAMADHDSATSPLLSPLGPPVEAFVSFQRLNPESCWSPFSTRSVVNISQEASEEYEDQSSFRLGDWQEEVSTEEDDAGV
jgi:hypothetical protein